MSALRWLLFLHITFIKATTPSPTSQLGPYELYIYYNESNIDYWINHLPEYSDIVKQAVFDTFRNLTGYSLNYDDESESNSWPETYSFKIWSKCGIANLNMCMLFNYQLDPGDDCPSVSMPHSKYAEYAAVAEFYIASDGNTNNCQNYILYIINNQFIPGNTAMLSIFQKRISNHISQMSQKLLAQVLKRTTSVSPNNATQVTQQSVRTELSTVADSTQYNTMSSQFAHFHFVNATNEAGIMQHIPHQTNILLGILSTVFVLLIIILAIMIYVCKYKGIYDKYFTSSKYKNVKTKDSVNECAETDVKQNDADESKEGSDQNVSSINIDELEVLVMENFDTVKNIINRNCNEDTNTTYDTHDITYLTNEYSNSHVENSSLSVMNLK